MRPSLRDWAARDGTRIAVIASGVSWSYAALADRVGSVAARLRAQGAKRGERVAVVASHGLDTVVAVLAVVETGATVVPLHARWTDAERRLVLDDARARLVVSEGSIATLPATTRDANGSALGANDGDDLAVVYTSGSTGLPRGVRLTCASFVASAAAHSANVGWREGERWLSCLPVAHVGGLSIVVRAMIGGGCIVIPEMPRAGGITAAASAIVRSIERDGATMVSFVPTVLDAVLEVVPTSRAPRSLRAVLVGGARAPQPLVERACSAGWPVLRTYGLTEACSQVATQPIDEAGRAIDDCGRALSGIEVRTDDDGTIGVRGAVVARGVVGDDGPITDGDGWLWTSDVGALDASGRLRVLGRRTEMIVTGGENVWPAEVERVIESLPGVEGVRVVAVEDPRFGEIVAAVIATGDREVDRARVAAAASERLAAHRRPRRWLFVRALPMGANGKIDATRARNLVIERGETF